jgi:hypothetical protein
VIRQVHRPDNNAPPLRALLPPRERLGKLRGRAALVAPPRFESLQQSPALGERPSVRVGLQLGVALESVGCAFVSDTPLGQMPLCVRYAFVSGARVADAHKGI